MPNIRRFIVYILGLVVLSFGIAFSIRSGLGVSPVSSIPYALSRISGQTVGFTTTAFYSLCIVLQLFILKKDFKLRHLLQFVFSYVFGLFTDMSMFLTKNLATDIYPVRLAMLAFSLVLIAFGVYTVVLTDVVMNAPDGLVKTIADHWHVEFSKVKSIFDLICVSTSIILSLVFMGNITGLREGTIIASLSIGRLIGVVSRRYKEKIASLYT